jgi:hypothetical protein
VVYLGGAPPLVDGPSIGGGPNFGHEHDVAIAPAGAELSTSINPGFGLEAALMRCRLVLRHTNVSHAPSPTANAERNVLAARSAYVLTPGVSLD